MRVSKIHVSTGSGYSFLILISYPLRVLSVDTHEYKYYEFDVDVNSIVIDSNLF